MSETHQQEIEDLKAELAKAQANGVQKELAVAKAELAEVHKQRRQAEFLAKAEAYKPLGEASQIASVLLAADEHFTDEEQMALDSLLKASAERVEKGDLFKRLSKDAGDESQSWEDRLAQAARDRVAKGTSSTVEQAKVAIMHEDSDLRKEYADSVRS